MPNPASDVTDAATAVQAATKTVLLVGGDLSNGGGVNRVIRDLSTIFSERLEFNTIVLALNEEDPSYAFSPKVRIERRPEAASRLGFWRLMREIGRRDYDHVIGFWHWDNIRIALALALAGKAPILTEHTSWHHAPRKTRMMRFLTYRLAKAVCVLNPPEFEYYRKFLRDVALIPNPVPKLPAPAGVGKEKLILAVGHLIDRKNFRDAVLAMAASGLADDGWRLVIVGTGPEEKALEALVRELGLTGAVWIEPPTGEIALWYARASIMLVTSKIEVFSLVLAEAMQFGVVPLAYAADGPAFLLRDHQDLVVAPGDVEALSRELTRLGRSGELQARGEAMKATVETRFSEEVIADRWRELLDSADR